MITLSLFLVSFSTVVNTRCSTWVMRAIHFIGIGYATSPDGILWEKHPDNPVLDIGAAGEWDDQRIVSPAVLLDGTTYKMWYTTWRVIA